MKKKGDSTEFKIKQSAKKVFLKSGYQNAKIADIAKEAGISRGLIYFYFESKEDLFLSVLCMANEELLNFMKLYFEMSATMTSGKERLMGFFAGWLNWTSEMSNITTINHQFWALGGNLKVEDSDSFRLMYGDPLSWMKTHYYKQTVKDYTTFLQLGNSFIEECLKQDNINNKLNAVELYFLASNQILGFENLLPALQRFSVDKEYDAVNKYRVKKEQAVNIILDAVWVYINK